MKRPVENRLLGKLLRTIGYIAVAASSAIFAIILLNETRWLNEVEVYKNIVTQIAGLDVNLFDGSIALMVHFGGLFLLIWCLSGNTVFRVLATLLLAYLFLSVEYSGNFLSYGLEGLTTIPELKSSLKPFFDSINNIWVKAQVVLEFIAVFFIWLLFAYKRPKRASTGLIHVGYFIGAIPAITLFVHQIQGIEVMDIVTNICYGAYAGFYVFVLLGSVFGILGFMRK